MADDNITQFEYAATKRYLNQCWLSTLINKHAIEIKWAVIKLLVIIALSGVMLHKCLSASYDVTTMRPLMTEIHRFGNHFAQASH